MLYLARKLRLPSGSVLNNHVVCVDDGVVAWWTPFKTECQSMIFVDELLLSSNPYLSSNPANGGSIDASDVLYLYEVKPGGVLVRI